MKLMTRGNDAAQPVRVPSVPTLPQEELEEKLVSFRSLDERRRKSRAFLLNNLFWQHKEGSEELNGRVAVLTAWALTTNSSADGLPGVPLCIVEAALYRITGFAKFPKLRHQTVRTLRKIASSDPHLITVLLHSLNEHLRRNGHRVRLVHHFKAGIELKPFPVLKSVQ